MKIAIFGAGAWGTALAISACKGRGDHYPTALTPVGHDVSLWVRDPVQAASIRSSRQNLRYLPGVDLPAALQIQSLDDELLLDQIDADLLVMASPMAGLRTMLQRLQGCQTPVAWLCKGFESVSLTQADGVQIRSQTPGLLAHEVQVQVAPNLKAGVLSGPSFAQEVAQGKPTALVAASEHAHVREVLVAAFHSPELRVYANDDIVGVEVGGAVKNVLAIATGLCDGLQLGLNARAALITRGLSEMTRLGVALGARAETFMGLSGLGDLVLTATGDLSRNRRVGLALAQGQTLQQAVASLGHVAEGVMCAHTVLQRAMSLKIEMPITQAVVALLQGQVTPTQAVATLMGREARDE